MVQWENVPVMNGVLWNCNYMEQLRLEYRKVHFRGGHSMWEDISWTYIILCSTESQCIYEITKSWVKVLIISKIQNKSRHNEKGLMFLCLSCQDINIRHDVLLMRKITACFHAVNTETVSMVWTCRFARKWTASCMGVSLNGHLITPSLSRFKKHLSSSLEPSQPSYWAGISSELHLVAAWPYKPYRTGCEGPVQCISARSVHYIHS